ncbi:MAG: cysteine-rich CWC family protein [Flavisolibacter sp.]
MQKNCSKCGVAFSCQNETSGCWCESVHLSKEVLVKLKEAYDNCLCAACLKSFEVTEHANNESGAA